jgi:hypothetical protein
MLIMHNKASLQVGNILYIGIGFQPAHWIISGILSRISLQKRTAIRVLGSFPTAKDRWTTLFRQVDFFITGENRQPEFRRAKKQIGFWRSYKDRDDVFRFPNWMWHLDWPELENQPAYPRYGMRLSIDRLMRPISDSYTKEQLLSRLNLAVLFSKHLKEPRHRLFQLTDAALGCDGFGGAFGTDDRQQPKMPVMEGYRFSLCPENSIGDGYITEKIPEAFHSGCIPISWCRPEDLAEDFNPEAVVNLYGLDDQQCRDVLAELIGAGDLLNSLISVPLLLERPRLEPLIEFIQRA